MTHPKPSRARERRQRDPATEQLHDAMRIASARWQQLNALAGRGTGSGEGRGSTNPTIPIVADFVDHTHALTEYHAWWNNRAKGLLDPSAKWQLGVPCPYQADNHPDISVTLIAWPNRELVRCPVQDCATWAGKDEIEQLGKMVTSTGSSQGVQVPTRGSNLRGARPPWERLTGASGIGGAA